MRAQGWRWQQHKLGGDGGRGQVCRSVDFSFETKEKGGRGGEQVTPRPMTISSVVSISVRPSRVLSVNIQLKESCKILSLLLSTGYFFPFPIFFFFSPWLMLLHFPDRLVSCSRSTLAPCPRRGPSGTGGAKGFEARRGNTGTLRAVSCWGGTGCQFEVHTAGQWVGEKRRFGAETCYGYLLFGGRYGWPRC